MTHNETVCLGIFAFVVAYGLIVYFIGVARRRYYRMLYVLEHMDGEKLYLADVQAFMGISEKMAQFICDRAVAEGSLELFDEDPDDVHYKCPIQ
jgi:hypothetical protein